MSTDDFRIVFDELVARHRCETATDKAIARSLARALCAEESNPALISQLTSLLPPPQPAADTAAPKVDLGRLSDKEIFVWERLVRIASGVEPIRQHRRKSNTHWAATRAAAIADAVKQRGPHAHLTDDERREIRDCLSSVVWAAGETVLGLWPEHLLVQGASYDLPPPDLPPKPLDNVVPLRSQPTDEKLWPGAPVAGNLVVSQDLHERYPNLRYDPPVGKF